VALGGGFATIGRIKREVVDERGWLDERAFLENVAVGSVLPGATATNLIVMISSRVAGVRGALVGAIGFILPDAILMTMLAAYYAQLRGVAAIGGFMDGLSAAVVGVVVAVALELRQAAVRRLPEWLIVISAALALALHLLPMVAVIGIAALVGIVATRAWRPPRPTATSPSGEPPPSAALVVLSAGGATAALTALSVFLVFAKVSTVTFGGFAMVPAIGHEAVGRGWLDAQTFADGVGLSQITPGPGNMWAAFVGYRAARVPGALAAILGMFGPPSVIAAVAAGSLARVQNSRLVQGALRGVGPAIVGVILAAAWQLGQTSASTAITLAIAGAALAIRVLRPRSSILWPLLLGGAVGVLLTFVRR
jgi:chromate transporter